MKCHSCCHVGGIQLDANVAGSFEGFPPKINALFGFAPKKWCLVWVGVR